MTAHGDSPTAWTQFCEECSIPEVVFNALWDRGYESINSFNFSVDDEEGLNSVIEEVLLTKEAVGVDAGVTAANLRTHPMAGKLRRLWWDSWSRVRGSSGSSGNAAPQAAVVPENDWGWAAAPPPGSRSRS